jgi:hypothetical protein
MNYIFLDIDGVLNNKNHYHKMHKKYGGRFACEDMPFYPRSLKNLKWIIERTGGKNKTKIVLSSSWRMSNNCMIVLKARLAEYGIRLDKNLVTPRINGERGLEIKTWLDNNATIDDSYVIIDDEINDISTYFLKGCIVHTNWTKGLTYFKAKEAIDKIYKQN